MSACLRLTCRRELGHGGPCVDTAGNDLRCPLGDCVRPSNHQGTCVEGSGHRVAGEGLKHPGDVPTHYHRTCQLYRGEKEQHHLDPGPGRRACTCLAKHVLHGYVAGVARRTFVCGTCWLEEAPAEFDGMASIQLATNEPAWSAYLAHVRERREGVGYVGRYACVGQEARLFEALSRREDGEETGTMNLQQVVRRVVGEFTARGEAFTARDVYEACQLVDPACSEAGVRAAVREAWPLKFGETSWGARYEVRRIVVDRRDGETDCAWLYCVKGADPDVAYPATRRGREEEASRGVTGALNAQEDAKFRAWVDAELARCPDCVDKDDTRRCALPRGHGGGHAPARCVHGFIDAQCIHPLGHAGPCGNVTDEGRHERLEEGAREEDGVTALPAHDAAVDVAVLGRCNVRLNDARCAHAVNHAGAHAFRLPTPTRGQGVESSAARQARYLALWQDGKVSKAELAKVLGIALPDVAPAPPAPPPTVRCGVGSTETWGGCWLVAGHPGSHAP